MPNLLSSPPGREQDRAAQAAKSVTRARQARARLTVDLAVVRENYQRIKSLSGGARVMAVVKGDAYGFGAVPIARLLDACGAEAFAVDNAAEGIELRAAGVKKPILIIDGDLADNAECAVAYGLLPGIAQEDLLASYERAAARARLLQPVWLVANVGFNRSGYRDEERFARFVRAALDCQHLEVHAVYAHLTNSNAEADVSLAQIGDYQRLAGLACRLAGRPLQTSLFASHGIPRWAADIRTDWVRPGLLLYGEHAFDDCVDAGVVTMMEQFQPAARLTSRIIHLLDFDRPEAIGYGQRVVTHAGQRLATVATGFGQGYPPGNNNTDALVGGHRRPLFGAVGMDALQIDVTAVPAVALDQEVTLLGSEGGERITASALARSAGRSPYELLRGLRYPRRYVDSAWGPAEVPVEAELAVVTHGAES